jgi:hypothetical protein
MIIGEDNVDVLKIDGLFMCTPWALRCIQNHCGSHNRAGHGCLLSLPNDFVEVFMVTLSLVRTLVNV